MLCDKCKAKEAVFHYKVSNNGKTTETHLCGECAASVGISTDTLFGSANASPFSGAGIFSDDDVFGSIFGGIMGKALHAGSGASGLKAPKRLVCPSCGMTENELSSTGKLGCATCCKTFAKILEPTVAKIHGNVAHTGKAPKGFSVHLEKKNEIESLKKQLSAAIEAQEYEQAAKLRDRIREIEGMQEFGKDNNNPGGAK